METEDDVRRDADAKCPICSGHGWHWGWDQYHDPVMLRCPCVDRIRKSAFHASRHAIARYRERVLGCPERERSDEALQRVMSSIVASRRPKKFKRTNFIPFKPWGILVMHRGYIASVLGPGMRESRL